MANEEYGTTPAYLPWKTFMNTLDALTRHMPNRIDRTAFPGQSGSAQNQLLLTFRFFGLVTEDGTPTADLHALATSIDADRRAAFRRIVERCYAPLFNLNLTKATPGQFAEEMTDVYNISGDTRLKATRFFLNAVEYLGIEVSPLLLKDRTKVSNGNAPKRRRASKQRADEKGSDAEGTEDIDEFERQPAAESRSVTLRSGGTLTLSATAKFMSLTAADRKFVFELIDRLDDYEASQQ